MKPGISALPPEVTAEEVRWRIPRAWAPAGVQLEVDWVLGAHPDFQSDGAWWTYRLARPPAERLEYRLRLGGAESDPVLDPTNPQAVPNPFGDRSEIRFPGYREPAWLSTSPAGAVEPIELDPGRLGQPVPTRLWSPPGLPPGVPAPLLVAHDGSGLAQDGSLLAWATVQSARQPLRVALLDSGPGCRDRWYAADPDYAAELVEIVLPALRDRVAVSSVIGLAVSLGALALLAIQRQHPAAFDGLALQSGSFFNPEDDPQESNFPHFDHITATVAEILATPAERPVPTLITCGSIEENLANNRRVAAALAARGEAEELVVLPDAHNMIAWRNGWTPHLGRLLRAAT